MALARRDALAPARRVAASAAIATRVASIIAALRPKHIAAYVAMRSEADPAPILDAALAGGAEIALPAIAAGQTLVFRSYQPGHDLVSGGFGTLVPVDAAPLVDPDLIIVPVVGFDRAGTRIGYGKGHYDRAIAAMRARGISPPLVGIAFAAQEVDTVSHEPHDVRLDWIVTEDETLDFRKQASGG